jgi:glutaredoxin 2
VKLGENSKKYFQHLQKEKKEKVERNEGFEENTELLHSIKKDQKKCLALATEKIQIALQTYQGVESYIKMLDKKIKNFDQELKEQGGLDNCISDDLNYMPQLQPTKKNHCIAIPHSILYMHIAICVFPSELGLLNIDILIY